MSAQSIATIQEGSNSSGELLFADARERRLPLAKLVASASDGNICAYMLSMMEQVQRWLASYSPSPARDPSATPISPITTESAPVPLSAFPMHQGNPESRRGNSPGPQNSHHRAILIKGNVMPASCCYAQVVAL